MEKLIKTNEIFFKMVEKEERVEELLNLFERYFNYLNKNLEQSESAKEKSLLVNFFYQMLYRLVNIIQKKSLIMKEYSKKWNAFLVGKTLTLAKNRQKHSKKDLEELMGEILRENDFPTKAYCYQVLSQSGVLDYSKMVVGEKEFKNTVRRPRLGGGWIDDDGRKYYHLGQKELMTYDECTEKGLGHHLLAYPIGSELQGCAVGFDEPDDSKVEKTNKMEWVESAMTK